MRRRQIDRRAGIGASIGLGQFHDLDRSGEASEKLSRRRDLRERGEGAFGRWENEALSYNWAN